jgi:hypothetical protein
MDLFYFSSQFLSFSGNSDHLKPACFVPTFPVHAGMLREVKQEAGLQRPSSAFNHLEPLLPLRVNYPAALSPC